VGAITNGEARTVSLPLAFLTPERRYRAEIYRDGDTADYRSESRFELAIEQRRVRSDDTLSLRLAPGGGLAIRFTPEPP
jgi:alpha-glucosidase